MTTVFKQYGEILEALGIHLDVTSVWLCQHDPAQQVSLVVGEYRSSYASALESQSDLFTLYDETSNPEQLAWLKGETHAPRVIQVNQMSYSNPEKREYIVNGVRSLLILPVYDEADLWGYIELWETRHNRSFDETDIQIAQQEVDALKPLLKDHFTNH